MRTLNRANTASASQALFYMGAPLIVTFVLWSTSLHETTAAQIAAAFILCAIPWVAYQKWLRGAKDRIPLFVLVSAMYWIAFVIPIFWTEHEINLIGGRHQLSEDSITQTLYLVVIGLLALWIGMATAGRWRFMESARIDIHANPSRWNYLRLLLLLSVLLRLAVPMDTLGSGGRQFLAGIETVTPSLVFAILFRYYLRGAAAQLDKVLLAGYILIALVAGIASGWLSSFVGLVIVAIAVYVYERRRLPLIAIIIGIPIVLFLQPGKEKFRQQYWRAGASESYVERFNFWMDSSWSIWEQTILNPGEGQGKDLAGKTLGRLSLLQQTANVVESTPERIPYQNGRLYSYMSVTFIPRLFWPDKPSVNDANRWYQMAYRLTSRDNLNGVSIAVGYLPESYINFGWFGPPAVMFGLGILLGLFDKVLLRSSSGLLLNSVGVSLVPGLLPVDAQLAQYLAGVGQQIVVALILFAPMFDLHRRQQRLRTLLAPGTNHKKGAPELTGNPSQPEVFRRS